jgi:hypothetical protein
MGGMMMTWTGHEMDSALERARGMNKLEEALRRMIALRDTLRLRYRPWSFQVTVIALHDENPEYAHLAMRCTKGEIDWCVSASITPTQDVGLMLAKLEVDVEGLIADYSRVER